MSYDNSTLLTAFLLTLFAGLATGIGSLMALLANKTNKKFLSVALGFSAGIMIYISFVEILASSRETLSEVWGETLGHWGMIGGFFAGIALIGIIDALVPNEENPHEVQLIESTDKSSGTYANPKKLMRLGLMSALALGIHNFPEGLATFMAALYEPELGVSIAIAIAIHNIPEGIAVSVPIYFATQSKKKAFKYSFLSGLSEPAGAIIGFLILMPFMSEAVFGITFALIAGIMVYISLDELLPAAREYGQHHLAISGLITGMLVMAISLAL